MITLLRFAVQLQALYLARSARTVHQNCSSKKYGWKLGHSKTERGSRSNVKKSMYVKSALRTKGEADLVPIIDEKYKFFFYFFVKKISESLESSNMLLFQRPKKVSTQMNLGCIFRKYLLPRRDLGRSRFRWIIGGLICPPLSTQGWTGARSRTCRSWTVFEISAIFLLSEPGQLDPKISPPRADFGRKLPGTGPTRS